MNLFSEGIDPELNLSNPDEWIPVVEEVTQIQTHPRHPWVGDVVYTAYSGSHQDAIRKCLIKQQEDSFWNVAYLPINPKDIGRDYEAIIRVNSQSGKAGSAFVLAQEYGLNLPKWMQLDFAPIAQKLAEKQGGVVSHKDLYTAFSHQYNLEKEAIQVNHYQLRKEGDLEHLSIEVNGEVWEGTGNGTLSALCDAAMPARMQLKSTYARTATGAHSVPVSGHANWPKAHAGILLLWVGLPHQVGRPPPPDR